MTSKVQTKVLSVNVALTYQQTQQSRECWNQRFLLNQYSNFSSFFHLFLFSLSLSLRLCTSCLCVYFLSYCDLCVSNAALSDQTPTLPPPPLETSSRLIDCLIHHFCSKRNKQPQQTQHDMSLFDPTANVFSKTRQIKQKILSWTIWKIILLIELLLSLP